ncbi:MAG: hypothetical protein R2733_26165 [Acidimicrobiales bacterium]
MLLAGACSSPLTEDDLVEAYQASHPEVTDDQAACVVGALVDAFEVEGVELELEAPTPTAAFGEAQYRAQFHCGQTGDVHDQLVAMLLERDLEADAADCVATALVDQIDDDDLDVLVGGELTDQFFDKYFTATYDCGALPG